MMFKWKLKILLFKKNLKVYRICNLVLKNETVIENRWERIIMKKIKNTRLDRHCMAYVKVYKMITSIYGNNGYVY